MNLITPKTAFRPNDKISLAILTHAYKPLGGSSKDYPLAIMARWLKDAGYFVILYDRQSTTWTGDAEVNELEHILRDTIFTRLSIFTLSKVIIGGYSAGSLIASRLAKPDWMDCEVQYLLISHPLSVSWALNLFRGAQAQQCLHRNLKHCKMLAIWGTNDQFTGVNQYRQWNDDLRSKFPNTWSSIEVGGADHFWKSLDTVYNRFVDWIT
ncbi:hypothetical protein E3P77_03734 [Wallemia ichthyophaga]|uniref:AB hydrolase-1 domain-containing protein n=1 Tax=Wallemia ichthyophaga TaxID=245174 RepID=A0A4T0F5F0_WALIC|nr:hypothetical protein E3P91_01197 [Wallemia ichthyophaga]TIA82619.1 hypothetical protein E3P98_01337 [Wallemia ichthyophaga]TIB01495.1 hypothetical protein E3P95_01339 [Wallemia ichthyophaga]TIB02451.1 hypothetical protein E3P94_01471 [Wallemia ichthyophaga]TIB14566.1 hypothetical protein E3P90_01162 [Wallemia ichthyophaga]